MKPIILIHAALGNWQQMEPLGKKLSECYQVHYLNLPGHEFEKPTMEFTISLFKDYLLSFIENEGLVKPSIFGYSLGGYVACSLATTHGTILEKIICYGTKWSWNKEFAQKEAGKLNPELLEQKAPAMVEVWKKRFGNENWKIVLKKTASMMLDLGSGQGISENDLKNISNPVLLLRGTEDRMVTEEETIKTASILPNAKYLAMEGLVHQIEHINIETLARKVIN